MHNIFICRFFSLIPFPIAVQLKLSGKELIIYWYHNKFNGSLTIDASYLCNALDIKYIPQHFLWTLSLFRLSQWVRFGAISHDSNNRSNHLPFCLLVQDYTISVCAKIGNTALVHCHRIFSAGSFSSTWSNRGTRNAIVKHYIQCPLFCFSVLVVSICLHIISNCTIKSTDSHFFVPKSLKWKKFHAFFNLIQETENEME